MKFSLDSLLDNEKGFEILGLHLSQLEKQSAFHFDYSSHLGISIVAALKYAKFNYAYTIIQL